MPWTEFNETPVYHHLREYFLTRAAAGDVVADLPRQEDQLIKALKQLMFCINIPTSRLDDGIREIIQETLGFLPVETAAGLNIAITDVPDITDEMYRLTVLGEIEEQLRECIVGLLRRHLQDVDRYVDELGKEHDQEYTRAWERYNEEFRQFEENLEDGNCEYDYDGPVVPEEPDIQSFDREAEIAVRKEDLAKLDLENPAVILEHVPIESKEFLGDLLHECFEDRELIDAIISNLDFSHLDKEHIRHFLRTKDFYFPGCDILKRGFLLAILIDNVQHDFKFHGHKLDIDSHVEALLKAMVAEPICEELLVQYNAAAVENDNLKLQRVWYYLSVFCGLIEKLIKTSAQKKTDLNIPGVTKQIKKKFEEIQRDHGESLKALIKVFPSDRVDCVFYPGIAMETQQHDPSCDARLELKPCFHTLELMAREAHAALSKVASAKSEADRTNVVSAMLCFVISVESEEKCRLAGYQSKQVFINVPINVDSNSLMLSIDEAFQNEHDIETSIGSDLERGTHIAGRMITLPPDEEVEAKRKIQRFIGTLKLSADARAEMCAQIDAAGVAAPAELAYLGSSDIAKSTEHRHSERVLNRVLKAPANIAKIILAIRKRLIELDILEKGTYTIHSGALLVYSYPNSICDPCSISFLALQNSYEQGFLAEFIKAANTNKEGEVIKLRTRGFNSVTQKQDPNEFSMTVIAGSSKVFAKDSYAKLVADRPEAKYVCHVMPQMMLSPPGINLKHARKEAANDRFYEYTADSQLHVDDKVKVPYGGLFFMSGSKQSKLSSAKKQTEFEAALQDVVKKSAFLSAK